MVGPFNEHLLTPASQKRYQGVKETIAGWLETSQIPHVVPPVLASEQYGDSSHPLTAGYAELARQLWADSLLQNVTVFQTTRSSWASCALLRHFASQLQCHSPLGCLNQNMSGRLALSTG